MSVEFDNRPASSKLSNTKPSFSTPDVAAQLEFESRS
jgi:hypothetical protein